LRRAQQLRKPTTLTGERIAARWRMGCRGYAVQLLWRTAQAGGGFNATLSRMVTETAQRAVPTSKIVE
jgi:hypothetical protein